MFWLIETHEQFENFKNQASTTLFVQQVGTHPEIHPGIYAPICLYIKDVEKDVGFIINFRHPEALSVDILAVKEYLKTVPKLYTIDKKAFNYFCYRADTYGLQYREVKTHNSTITYYNQKFYNDSELNLIIPIVKHYEYWEDQYRGYRDAITTYTPNEYNQDLNDVFWFIERNALKVSKTFEDHFEVRRPFLSRFNDYIFTQYNLNTTTGRPSNTFNNLNFAALNKDNGCRSAFIPRNDFLMEIDLTAYHPTLISKLVGYKSPTGDVYEDFALKYSIDRNEAKNLVFKQLYGHVFDEYKDFEFFQLSGKLIQDIWEQFTTEGKVVVTETGKIFTAEELPDMNPQKLFNYLIQHWETYNNVQLLKSILQILNRKESKVVLYVYDAIVIDADKEEKEEIEQILDVFEMNNLKIKVSYGKDYGTLQPL